MSNLSQELGKPIDPLNSNEIRGDSASAAGHVGFEFHDRTIMMHSISDQELTVLEVVKGNAETTWLGIAIGAMITLAVVLNSVKKLSPYHHALFVIGLWVSIAATVYFANRARTASSLVKRMIAEIRKRKDDSLPTDFAAANSVWEWCKKRFVWGKERP